MFCGVYLALALPLQVHHTHVHDGPQVGERLHHRHIRALFIAVHVELQRNKENPLYKSLRKDDSTW